MKANQAVEWDDKYKCSINSTIGNLLESDLLNHNQKELECEEEESICGRVDILVAECDARRHSKWINNLEVRIKEVGSWLYGRRLRDRIRRMFRRPQCLRRLRMLMRFLSRCFRCRRRRVYKCATSAVFNPDEISELWSV